MRICIDLSPAVHHRAGLGRYAQELTLALLALDAENEYLAFYNRAAEARVAPPLDCLPHLTTKLGDKPWRTSVLLAQTAHLPQDRLFPGVDLFHATDHLLPCLSHVRSVFTLHDLTFCLYPETHASLNRWFLTLMMPRFLRATDAIIADSECTKRDAGRVYGLDESRIQVIYPGVNRRFRPCGHEIITTVRCKYGLPEHFILYVGTIEPRKNLTVLLEGYLALKNQALGHRLVLAGKRGWLCESFFKKLRELGLEGEVIFPGFVPDEDLPGLYSAADLFVFPSLYEGFGLPVLEAMACGTPVVCSDTSSLPEVAGEAALLASPTDVRALIVAMRRALTDESLRTEMRAKGLAQASQFTWERTAKETLAIYRQVLGGQRARDH